LLFPLIFGHVLASQVSLYSAAPVHLNRGLETACAYIRPESTRATITPRHDQDDDLRTALGYIGDCKDTLRLEIGYWSDRATVAAIECSADCVDQIAARRARAWLLALGRSTS